MQQQMQGAQTATSNPYAVVLLYIEGKGEERAGKKKSKLLSGLAVFVH